MFKPIAGLFWGPLLIVITVILWVINWWLDKRKNNKARRPQAPVIKKSK
jgi:hypothetical protein